MSEWVNLEPQDCTDNVGLNFFSFLFVFGIMWDFSTRWGIIAFLNSIIFFGLIISYSISCILYLEVNRNKDLVKKHFKGMPQ